MLDQAFDALKNMDWGTDRALLNPIDDAVIAAHGDAQATKTIEERLTAALKTKLTRDGHDYVCRKLMIVGTAASVQPLAELLADQDTSHMARFALERIPSPEAGRALHESLAKLPAALKIGVIASLGVRRDSDCVADLAKLLSESDATVARAAAIALGDIGTVEASKALAGAKLADDAGKSAARDASLACAERLLAVGNKADALAIYKTLIGADLPKHVRLAGTRGMLACAAKKD